MGGKLTMSVQIQWDDSHKDILHYHFSSRWTWDEFFPAFQTAHSEINQANRPIGVILSGPADMILPPNMLSNAAKVVKHKRSKNTAVLVFVTPSMFVRTMLRAISRLSSTEFRSADTLDDARNIALQMVAAAKNSQGGTLYRNTE
jgi:hypothetical protein